MLQDIRAEANYICRMTGREMLHDNVLEVMSRVPREHFVGKGFRNHAFENSPLPIGQGQTISQPFIVALMTDLVAAQPGDKVLEVGTGSGYQTAILAQLVEKLYTIEIIPELADSSRQRLTEEGYDNIHFRIGDGYYGWKEEAPFDVIMVTAAAKEIPHKLVEQLAPNGRMAIPVGDYSCSQDLILLQKDADGKVHTSRILPVAFVPLTGEH
jgi:protein-L-isoaspartate(D-aspartate) O-methyltransferase